MELGFFDYQNNLLVSRKFERKVNEILKNNISLIPSSELKKIYYKLDRYTKKCISKIKHSKPYYMVDDLENRIENLEFNNYLANVITGVTLFVFFLFRV